MTVKDLLECVPPEINIEITAGGQQISFRRDNQIICNMLADYVVDRILPAVDGGIYAELKLTPEKVQR